MEASTHEVGICFQAGVHEQNVKSRSDGDCEAGGFANAGEAPASVSKHCEADGFASVSVVGITVAKRERFKEGIR